MRRGESKREQDSLTVEDSSLALAQSTEAAEGSVCVCVCVCEGVGGGVCGQRSDTECVYSFQTEVMHHGAWCFFKSSIGGTQCAVNPFIMPVSCELWAD